VNVLTGDDQHLDLVRIRGRARLGEHRVGGKDERQQARADHTARSHDSLRSAECEWLRAADYRSLALTTQW
jgi:hypothetical protein